MAGIPYGELNIRRLSHRSRVSSFCCKEDDLNDFIKNDALIAHSNMTSRTYLCYLNGIVVGFATLAAATIEVKSVEEPPIEGYTPKTYPCIKLARFAVDKNYEGKGIGPYLLRWVMGKFYQISDEIGCRYITVDSKKRSMLFYEKHDFTLVEKTRNKLHPTFYLDMCDEGDGTTESSS